MAKTPKQAPAAPTAKKRPTSGIKVTVAGQFVLKKDRDVEVKTFEEAFFLPEKCRAEALHVIKHYKLIDSRLKRKHDKDGDAKFRRVRKCGIRTITIAEDIGLEKLEAVAVNDMDEEQMKTLVVMKGWPRDIIDEAIVEFDLREKIAEIIENGVAPEAVKQGAGKGEDEGLPQDPVSKKAKWDKLD